MVFTKLKYPDNLINSAVKKCVDSKIAGQNPLPRENQDAVRIVIPFKDQASVDIVKKRIDRLSVNIGHPIQPVFVSRKLNEDLKAREVKPAIVNRQCLVYNFVCNLCDAGYVGYTKGHLHDRVDGHKQKSSSIYKHYVNDHGCKVPDNLLEYFQVLTKCQNKFDCLVKEMLLIRMLNSSLNVQTDSIRAKVFI